MHGHMMDVAHERSLGDVGGAERIPRAHAPIVDDMADVCCIVHELRVAEQRRGAQRLHLHLVILGTLQNRCVGMALRAIGLLDNPQARLRTLDKHAISGVDGHQLASRDLFAGKHAVASLCYRALRNVTAVE
eukprot:2483940-Prymnesium_polylepis.2